MFPYSVWFDSGYIFMSVYRGLFHVQNCRKLRSSRSCSSSLVIGISFVAQRQSLMVQTVRRTIEISQLLNSVIDVPVVQVVQVLGFCSYGSSWSSTPLSLRRVYHKVQTVRQTWDSPVASHCGRCPRCAGRAGSLPCRDAEADSHCLACLADH